MEERCGNPGDNSLIRFDLSVAEIEEGLPALETAWRTRTAAQVVRIGVAVLRRVEDEAEERLPWAPARLARYDGLTMLWPKR